jgi:hypothetical protein
VTFQVRLFAISFIPLRFTKGYRFYPSRKHYKKQHSTFLITSAKTITFRSFEIAVKTLPLQKQHTNNEIALADSRIQIK